MTKCEIAQQILLQNQHTCVAVRNDPFYTSDLKGIAPLMTKLLDDPMFFRDAYIADRVIGKSAAILLIYGKISGVHAEIISEHACSILDEYAIPYTFTKKVPFIINNARTAMCPMEASVLETDEVQIGFEILKQKFIVFRT
jgi:hypothetical protein